MEDPHTVLDLAEDFFTPDAPPDATLPIYPSLGPTIWNALSYAPPVAGEQTRAQLQLQQH